jgi:hypothetical protein
LTFELNMLNGDSPNARIRYMLDSRVSKLSDLGT